MPKDSSSLPVIVAKLFLPLTLLLVASVTYVLVGRQHDKEKRRDHDSAAAMFVGAEMRGSDTEPVVTKIDSEADYGLSPQFQMVSSSSVAETLHDTMVFISRIENFTDALLQTQYVTGKELRNAGAMLRYAVRIAPRKTELLRKQRTLQEAIDAGAVQDVAADEIESAAARDEIVFRAKEAFPFYRNLCSTLTEDAVVLEGRIRKGAAAIDRTRDALPKITAWEQQLSEIAAHLLDANALISEIRTQLIRPQGYTANVTHADIVLTLAQAEKFIGETGRDFRDLQRHILAEIPDPGTCAAEIETARDAIGKSAQLIEGSRLTLLSAADLAAVCKLFFQSAQPPFDDDAAEPRDFRQLMLMNRVLAAENSTLCTLLNTPQARDIRTLPPRMRYLIQALIAFDADRQLAKRRLEFIANAVAERSAGEKPSLVSPLGLTFYDPEKRPATLAVTLYDAVTMARITNAVVRLVELPDNLPRASNTPGRYDFRIDSPNHYTLDIAHRDYQPAVRKILIQPARRANETLTVTLDRRPAEKVAENPFLAPGTNIETRVDIDARIFVPLLRKYRNNPDAYQQLKTLRDDRVQLILSGLEPGSITLPLGITP